MAVTAQEFRRIALAFPGATEGSHMNHPDFRVGGKIFATLNYPTKDWGMVKLTPGEQFSITKLDPHAFVPVKGAWGKRGNTNVKLMAAKKSTLRDALLAAYRHVALKQNRDS